MTERRGSDGSGTDEAGHWVPPTPTVGFIVTRGRWRWTAYTNHVGIWAMQSARRFRGKTEAEALAKAVAYARKHHPDAIVEDPPEVRYL